MSLILITTPPCMVCHKTSTVKITSKEHKALKAGALIQKALPDRDADFRELVMTGTHPKCWDKMMEGLEE